MIFLGITTIIYTAFYSFGFDLFRFVEGFGPSWLIAIYILGAFIKKYEFYKKIKSSFLCIVGYLLLVILTLVSKVVITKVTTLILGAPNREQIFMTYVSPTILGCAICLVFLFYHMKFNKRVEKLISFAAPAAFGVYLFHMQQLVFDNVLPDKVRWIAELPELVIPIVVLGVSFSIFIIGICVDKIRAYLFKWLKIDVLSQKIELLVRNKINILINYISHRIVE